MLTYLKHVLPSEGWLCGTVFRGKAVTNNFFNSVEKLAQFLEWSDKQPGVTAVYYAIASYGEPGRRKQENVKWLKTCDADIDGGPDAVAKKHGYADRIAAYRAVVSFCSELGLPLPLCVSTGTGLHIHWVFTRHISPAEHHRIASALKRAMATHGLLSDPARTLDTASILRPSGTFNRKSAPVLVQAGALTDPVDPEKFENALQGSNSGSTRTSLADRCRADTGEGPARYSERIAASCAQIKKITVDPGSVPETIWYAAVGVLYFADDGDQFLYQNCAPEWHPTVTKKLSQVAKLSGATTCRKFHELDPATCEACPHWGKITSPISLGYEQEKVDRTQPVYVAAAGLPSLPDTFAWDSEKLVYTSGGTKGPAQLIVSEYPIFLDRVNKNEVTGEHSFTFAFRIPSEGWKHYCMDTRLFWTNQGLSDLSRFGPNIHDGELFRKYVRFAVDKHYKDKKLSIRYEQYGWKSGGRFLCGRWLYNTDGTMEEAQGIPELEVRSHWIGPGSGAKEGETSSLEEWIATANKLFTRGCEAQAAVLILAFASPLMCDCHPHEGGAIVSLVTRASAKGKTQALTAVASVWGDYQGIENKRRNSQTAQFLILAHNGNLPVINDEIALGDRTVVREWIKNYTEGRDKDRATRDGELKHVANGWQNILFTSSNSSLREMVGFDKGAEARVIELNPTLPEELQHEFGDQLLLDLARNGGYAGDLYLRYITNPEVRKWIKASIHKNMQELWKRTKLPAEYRFWIRTLAAAAVAATIVSKLGLLAFNPDNIIGWLYEQLMGRPIDALEEERFIEELRPEGWQVLELSAFVAQLTAKTLIIIGEYRKGIFPQVKYLPRDAILARFETGAGRLTVAADEMQRYARENELPFNEWRRYLIAKRVMSGLKKITLTAGTEQPGGQMYCYEVNLNHEAVSGNSNVVELKSQLGKPAASQA